ncbi:hypothetical protein TGAM01_v210608 [Trichoderma gamsii]|uniref:Uncharacterized protein n=1 Tax=Trichoderma gamsii TaxID=398673 RepID=A0A2P4Z898_9HYPO|nr:hypothetical protein TGAM01_v210608 [Trichoderma gamsii]PON20506.1 hypothetical protein TGAM01_v210608 [Trichoderma gamsii]
MVFCAFQLQVPSTRHLAIDLHERLCPPFHPGYHGPEQERVCNKPIYYTSYSGPKANNWPYRVMGIFWKCARIGERLSPYISICCVIMAVRVLSPDIFFYFQKIGSTEY